jgi:GT2 family glycosyltransferase
VLENAEDLERCLRSLGSSTVAPGEIIVVDDGSVESAEQLESLCRDFGAIYVRQAVNVGPAAARNAGVRAARGALILFLDADVEVNSDTIERLTAAMRDRPELDAIFGSYDDQPAALQRISVFRNLLHHYVHHRSAGSATTFWAGCGAMRREAFDSVGGFNEQYRLPSIEDVDLGQRLWRQGGRLWLDPSISVTHRKQWTLWGLFRTDLLNRAIPWTELAFRSGLPKGLNFGWYNLLSVGLAGLALALMLARFPLLAAAACLLLWSINWPVYHFMVRKRGIRILPASLIAHATHYLASACGLLAGAIRHLIKRDRWAPVVLGGLLAAGIAGQVNSRAYMGDYGGYPDESGHFVTAVFVMQWLHAPLRNPIELAERYYAQYPRLGLGHWPPLGYILQGAWMHTFGTSRLAVMIYILLTGVGAAWLIYELLWREAGRTIAAGAAFGWILSQHVQWSLQIAMLDLPAALLSLLAILAFREYTRAPGRASALAFGFCTACALLLKQQAIPLMLIPIFWVVLSQRWDLLRRWDFWIPVVPVALLAVPWYAVTMPLVYPNAAAWAGSGRATPQALLPKLWHYSGVYVALGCAVGVLLAFRRNRPAYLLWVSVLLSVAVTCIVITAMSEARHLLLGLAAQYALAFLALSLVPARARWFAVIVLLWLSARGFPPTVSPQYRSVAQLLRSGTPGNVLLTGRAEGPVIAAAVAAQPEPDGSRLWLRATKVMADVRWSGRVNRLYVQTPTEVDSLLRQKGINQVWLEPASDRVSSYERLLFDTLAERSTEWDLSAVRLEHGDASLYRRREPVHADTVDVWLPRLQRSIKAGPQR